MLFGSGDDPDAVKSIDAGSNGFTVEVPESWTEMDLNEDADIEMGNLRQEQYLLIIEEPGEDFTSDFTLDDYISIFYEILPTSFESPEATEIKNTMVGRNIPAKQFEITGSLEGVEIKYMLVAFEMGDVFYQINMWSTQVKYEANLPVFTRVIDSVAFDPEVLAAEGQQSEEEPAVEEEVAVQIITSTDSGLTMEFPETWTEGHESAEATIEMDSTISGEYIIVYEDIAEDFVDGYTLDDYMMNIYENMPSSFDTPEASEIIDVTIGDNIPAKQFEISGSTSGVKTKYQVTCAAADDRFYQIIAASSPSSYDAAVPVFDRILASATL
jgi:hypothetical protein